MAERVEVTTRQRLVHAARGLLEEDGYAAASVAAIAQRAGVSSGALYRHFPSKSKLFVEVFRDVCGHEIAAAHEAALAARGTVARIEAVIVTFAARALHNRRLSWALIAEPVDPLVDAERLAYRRDYCECLAELLRDGIAAGEIPDQDAELTAALLVGGSGEALVGPLSPTSSSTASEEAILGSLRTFCRRAVGAGETAVGG